MLLTKHVTGLDLMVFFFSCSEFYAKIILQGPQILCQKSNICIYKINKFHKDKKNIRNNNFSRKERDVVIKTSYKFELGIMSLAVFWLPVQLSIFVNYLLLLLPKVFLLGV